MQRIILHIDMNAYFASCAVLKYPQYKGKPLAVGSVSRRGIISTASYEARKYGVNSAMPTYLAKKICPELIVVDVEFELYEKYTKMFVDVIKQFSPIIEMASIDECYVDMTEQLKGIKNPLKVIKSIQTRILNEIGLPCSIGVAPNKFLAKMASDMKKPLGITIIRKGEVQQKIWPLAIGKMFGIGKKSEAKLLEMGINTIGELLTYPNQMQLKKFFGKSYEHFINCANGIHHSPVKVEVEDLKTVGHSRTLEYDTNDTNEILDLISKLSSMVSKRAKEEKLVGSGVSITIKYSNGHTISRAKQLGKHTNDLDPIVTMAKKIFDDNYDNTPIRLMGVTLLKTQRQEDVIEQLNLFEYASEVKKNQKNSEIKRIIKEINEQIGKEHLKIASEVHKK